MTVAQFQRVHEINNTTPDTVERLGWVVCHVFNKKHDEVNRMSSIRFLLYVNRLERKLSAKPSLFPVYLQTDATKITLGQFIECQHWLKNDLIQSLDLIAASILIDRGDHAKGVEFIRSVNYTRVYSQVLQFVESLEKLIKSYSGLFEPDEIEENEKPGKLHPFIERYGWIYSAKAVAEHEGVPLDEAFKLPIMQALNTMSYLKSKQSYDKQQAKN